MSKDMLGSVIRAAVGVPQERLETLAKIASAMATDSSMGEVVRKYLERLLNGNLISRLIVFEHNKYDHAIITVAGLGKDLSAGKVYKIVLVPGDEILEDGNRTTTNLRELGERYGYDELPNEIMLCVRALVSDEQMKKMGFSYILDLGGQIAISFHYPYLIYGNLRKHGEWVSCGSDYEYNNHLWDKEGAVAFLASVNN